MQRQFGDNIYGDTMPEYNGKTFDGQMRRYNFISGWSKDLLTEMYSPELVIIEDYSFGSTGRVFHIAENTGVLKYRLWKTLGGTLKNKDTIIETVPPTVIKKFASEKGNANKQVMQDAFEEQQGVNIKELLEQTNKQWNPSSDIIDAYFMAKYAYAIVTGEIEGRGW